LSSATFAVGTPSDHRESLIELVIFVFPTHGIPSAVGIAFVIHNP